MVHRFSYLSFDVSCLTTPNNRGIVPSHISHCELHRQNLGIRSPFLYGFMMYRITIVYISLVKDLANGYPVGTLKRDSRAYLSSNKKNLFRTRCMIHHFLSYTFGIG